MTSNSILAYFLVLVLICSTLGVVLPYESDEEAPLAGYDEIYIDNGIVTVCFDKSNSNRDWLWTYNEQTILDIVNPELFAIGNGSEGHILWDYTVREGFVVDTGEPDQWYGSNLLLNETGVPRLGVDREIMVPADVSYFYINYRITNEDTIPMVNGSLYQKLNLRIGDWSDADEGGFLTDIDAAVTYDNTTGMYAGFKCVSSPSAGHSVYMEKVENRTAEDDIEQCTMNNVSAWLVPDEMYNDFLAVLEVQFPSSLGPGESFDVTFNIACADNLTDLYSFLEEEPNIEKVHDISVLDLRSCKTINSRGHTMMCTAIVKNAGDFTESFDITLYYENATMATSNVKNVAPGTTREVNFYIPNIGYKPSSYTIRSFAHPVQGEVNVLDNYYENMTVNQIMGMGYAIVVLGNYQGEILWNNYVEVRDVYRTLLTVGFSADRIYCLSQPEYDFDLDGDGQNDVDAIANITNLQWAIENWAAERVGPGEPLYLYMHDHGCYYGFSIDYPEHIWSPWLSDRLDDLYDRTHAPIRFIYSACHSGSFINDLSSEGRVLITSSKSSQSSWLCHGREVFDHLLWSKIKFGHSLKDSFNYAWFVMHFLEFNMTQSYADVQTPLLDDNGDGIGHTGLLSAYGDGILASDIYIGQCEWHYPWISRASPGQTYNWSSLPSSIDVWAEVEHVSALVNVTAYLWSPDWEPVNGSSDTLVELDLQCFNMSDEDADGNWTASIPIGNFTAHTTVPNDFFIIIFAEEEDGSLSVPQIMKVEFTETGEPSNDSTAPLVSLEYPLDGKMVNGIIEINGTVLDDMSVERIELNVNGDLTDSLETSSSSVSYFEFELDTTTYENGPLEIMVTGYDSSNNSNRSNATLYLNNGIHEVTVTDTVPDNYLVAKGRIVNTTVTVANHGSYAETFNVTLRANGVSIGTYSITLDGLEYAEMEFSWDTSGFQTGNYSLEAYAWPVADELDETNNLLTLLQEQQVVIVDMVVSSIAMDAQPRSVIIGSTVTINGTLATELEGTDIDLSTRFNDGDWNPLATVQTDPDSNFIYLWTPSEVGSYETKATWPGDEFTEAAESEAITITVVESDIVPPHTVLTANGTEGDNDWFVSNVTVSLSATDDITGVNRTEYSYDNITWMAYSAPIPVNLEGTTNLYYRSIDNAGNPESVRMQVIKIDRSPPTGSIGVEGGAEYTNDRSVSILTNATDTISGVAGSRLSNNGVEWSEWSNLLQTSSWQLSPGDGVKSVLVQFKDAAGLISISYQVNITLDTTAPLAVAGEDQTINKGAIFNFDGSASTDGNGISSYTWQFKDGLLIILTGMSSSYQFNDTGTYTITLNITDPAGNWAVDEMIITVVESDTAHPDTDLVASGTEGDNGWFVSEVTVTLSATDDITGVNWTEYSYDNLTWSIYSTPFSVNVEGATYLYYRSIDNAGNSEPVQVQIIKIDQTSPTGSINMEAATEYTKDRTVTVMLNATDPVSGMNALRLSNDGLNWSEWEPLTGLRSWQLSPGDGVKSVLVQFKDAAGLISISYQVNITLDTTAPLAVAGEDQTIYKGETFNFNGSSSSDDNGIASYTWQFEDGSALTLTGASPGHQFNDTGTYTITLNVTDPAGNWATDTMIVTVQDEGGVPAEGLGMVVYLLPLAVIAIAAGALIAWRYIKRRP